MARPRTFDPDDILRETLFLFWRKGYEGTSLSDIEQATGVARMSLYNLFGDKERLFEAALERYIGATRTLYEKHLQDGGIADLEALIGVYAHPERLGPAGNWGCLMLNAIMADAGVSPRTRAAIDSFRHDAVARIAATLRRAQALGDVAPEIDCVEAADFILAALWGAKAAIRHAGTAEAAAPTQRMLGLFLHGLKPGPAHPSLT